MQKITLDLIPGKKMPSLHASQFDDGRAYHIDLTEKNEPYKLDGTEVLTVNERKGDNNICSLDIENTFADKTYVEFASTEQMCAVAGANICELVIKRGSVTLGTLNFILEIEPSPTEGGIESESEISNLERQIEEITEQVIGDDYYTAEETDEAIENATEGKAEKTYVDEELNKKADKSNTYTKTEVDSSLNNKMDKTNPTGTGSFSLNRKSGTTVGYKSVAVGDNCEASGVYSFAQGSNTKATGICGHSEGSGTEAFGLNSHSEGVRTVANRKSQHVYGEWNVIDNNGDDETERGAYVEIVGNGTSSNARSNARTLDWNGNETLAGDLTINGNQSVSGEITRLDGKIDNLPAPMIFKGTLGVGGTIQSLPTASASNDGFTYKVITDGTYAGQTAKVGDVFTSNGSAWVYIPSGDEDNDTWRNIKVNGVEKLGNGISSGAVDFEDTTNVKFEFDANGNKIKAKLDGIYTENEVDDLLEDKADADNTYTKEQVDDIVYNILPDDTASGSVANFNTSLELPIKSLEVDVNAVQESGTPTPATPLPISGWSAITLDVNGNTEVISLGGTYYGGHLTQDKAGHRQLVVTHKRYDLSALSWQVHQQGYYYTTKPDDMYKYLSTETPEWIAERYQKATGQWIYGHGSTIGYIGANGGLIYCTDSTTPSGYLVAPLTEPIIIDLLDGEPIITLNGTNNIYADTGDTSVVFKSSVNDYVNAHSGGGGLRSLGNSNENLSKGGGEEEPDESEDTEKTKLDETKVEVKEIGDDSNIKKLGGE